MVERRGPRASSTSSAIAGGMAREGAVTKVGRTHKVHCTGEPQKTLEIETRIVVRIKLGLYCSDGYL